MTTMPCKRKREKIFLSIASQIPWRKLFYNYKEKHAPRYCFLEKMLWYVQLKINFVSPPSLILWPFPLLSKNLKESYFRVKFSAIENYLCDSLSKKMLLSNCSVFLREKSKPFCLWSWKKTMCEKIKTEEHTSELQSHHDLVCRLLLEKKKNKTKEKKKKKRKHKKRKKKKQHIKQ